MPAYQFGSESWRQPVGTGAPACSAHAMAFDASRGRIILHGGIEVKWRSGLSVLDDVWEWDGTRWTRVW